MENFSMRKGGLREISRNNNLVSLFLSKNLNNFYEFLQYGLNKNYYDGIF